MKLLTPNTTTSSNTRAVIVAIQIGLILLLWSASSSTLLPSPREIGASIYELIAHKGVLREFFKSMTLCLKAIFFASLIAMFIAYLSTIPTFKDLCYVLRKFRFLTSVGLSFLFMKLSHDVDEQKLYLLVFGITTFLIDAIINATSTTIPELNYARTLKLNEWQVLWEVVIVGKMAQVFECIRQNFAIAWMMLATVENLCKSQGGIGVVLSDLNKWFKFEYVYAIQFLILFAGIMMDWGLSKLKGFLFPYTLLNVQK